MSTTLSRVLIATALCAAGGTADAGKRVVVLDFDGPKALADTGRDAVVRAVGEANDLIAAKRWLDAKASAARTKAGPKLWKAAAKSAGVDALIEGWVQVENRQKVLTVVLTNASSGAESDHVSIKLGPEGVTDATLKALRDQLEERLDWIDPTPSEPTSPLETVKIGAEKPAVLGPELPPAAPAKQVAVVEPSTTASLEPKSPDWLPDQPKRASYATPRVRVSGGVGWSSRSLYVGAENPDGVQQYSGVGAKQIGVDAAFYPWPRQKRDGILSGVGFSFGINQSLGSTVTFDDLEEVSDYSIDQHGWNAAVHYRAPLGNYFAIDGEVGYGSNTYNIQDASELFEVPNTSYSYLHAGTHVDLAVTDRASVGFGGKYFHVLGSGDLNSVDWYGPGNTSGLGLDANFIVPLPARLYVKGEIAYTRFKTSLDGVGQITEDEGAFETVDSNVSVGAKIGIEF